MARRTKLILATILFIALGVVLFSKREGTLLREISSTLPPHAEWAIADAPPLEVLKQKFHFLGEGAQALAFQSEDGKYVLKLFKMRRFTPSFVDQLCPHVVRRRYRNLNWVFNGYRSGYQDLRQDTGLVWIHLSKTNNLQLALHVTDADGTAYTIDADTTEFVIQEKAELIFDHLARLSKEGAVSDRAKAIAAIESLVERRIAKGYADRDKAVSNNYGFVGDRPIQLDIGRLYKGHKEGQLEHLQQRIARWKSGNAIDRDV